MAKRNLMKLTKIEYNHPISWDSDPDFLLLLVHALLLALEEQGKLDPVLFRYIEDQQGLQKRDMRQNVVSTDD